MRASKVSVMSARGGRAAAAAITVVAMGLAATPPAAGAESSLSRVAAASECPAVVDSEELAVEVAAGCGREVEVLESRTEWQTVHALPDGQMRLDAAVVAERTQLSGEWTDIDTSLVETGEGLTPAAPVVGMVFANGAPGQPLVRLQRDGHELTFDVPFEVSAPVVYGSTLEYRDVLEGVDLIVTVNEDGTGFSEVLRVDSPEAAADPRIAELVFPVVASDGLEVEAAEGGFVARDDAGDAVFASPAPAMWDSRGDVAARSLTPRVSGLRMTTTADGSTTAEAVVANRAARVAAPLAGDVTAVMDAEVEDGAVVVTPDAGLISDENAVWPLYLDPSVSADLADWTTVSSTGWIHYRYTGDDGLGYCNQTSSGCSTLFKSRMAWEFGGLSTIAPLDRPDIVSATFRAYGTHSYSCTQTPVSAWRVGGFTSNTGWPLVEMYGYSLHTQSVAHRAGCNNASRRPRWIEFDVTQALMQIAEEDRSAVAIALRDPSETSMAGWKRYRNDARLSVTYNRAPSTPTSPYLTATASSASLGCGTSSAPTWVYSSQPFLWATVSDPDGGNVMALFDVYEGSKLVWNGGSTAAQASGMKHVRHVGTPLPDGTTYSWTVYGYDASRTSATGRACYFRVDSEPPAAPSVQALEPEGLGQAAYPPDVESGGVGLVGRFQVASSSDDVVEFAYSFDSTDLLERQPVADPVISWSPEAPGGHTLRVQAIDRAGRVSGVVAYEFGVARPQQSVWLLEEGAGTTAADSGDFGNQLPLTLGDGPTWVDGPLTEKETGTDWALAFDDPGDGAWTASSAVMPGESFSVSAVVRSRGEAVSATAVSQDGVSGPAFELGQVAGEQCPDGVGPCWAFQMPSVDGAGSVGAFSDVGVPADKWVQITGTFDASSGTAAVHVCSLWRRPVSTDGVAASGAGLGVGPLRLGGSRLGDISAAPWLGEVAEVRVYDAVVGVEEMTRTCWPVAS